MSAQLRTQSDFTHDSKFESIRQYFDFTNIQEYAQDFGCIVSKRPLAVFFPPTIAILQQFMRLVSEYKIKVSCRGKGNSVFGQAQVENGVIVDLKNLNIDLRFDSDDAVTVPAYKTWLELTDFTKQKNKTVAVTVDNLDLTVAGTLSFGALGGTSYLCGSAADNVLKLEVITLDGEHRFCSETENEELFHAVLCGMGQFGIIVSVTLPMVTAKKQVNMYFLAYDNAKQFLQEQKSLYELKIFDHLKGFVRKKNDAWEYVIEAVTYYDEYEDPVISVALENLSASDRSMQSLSYWEFINLVTGFVQALRVSGKLKAPHPWYNVLMPEHEIEKHLIEILDTPHLTGTEPIIVYPMNSDCFKRPLFIKPEGETFYILGVLYNTSFEATNHFPYEGILQRNKQLYLLAKEKGGARYAVDAIPFTGEDWKNHYGEKWQQVCYLKNKYDTRNLLSFR